MSTPLAVAILAGGASRRMGSDKAALDWSGRPLLEHIAALAREAGAVAVAVVGRGAAQAGTLALPDAITGCGPLGGILAALRWQPRVLVLACDMPALTPAWLRWLWQRAQDFPGWTVPENQPLCAVYDRVLLPWLESVEPRAARGRRPTGGGGGEAPGKDRLCLRAAAQHTATGPRSLATLLADAPQQFISSAEMAAHGFGPELFCNLNTPAEYAAARPEPLTDSFGRGIHDLRISVTERCNYRCVYCRYGADTPALAEPLTWSDLQRLARVFVRLGISKVRLTGGEPLLREGLVDFVHFLSSLGVETAITTNGHLLADHATALHRAGLSRVTVSLDSLQEEKFARITRVRGGLPRVQASIAAAQAAGLEPVKVNVVLLRGRNDDELEAFAAFARERRLIIRFIEFMPLEQGELWKPGMVVPLAEIVERIGRAFPLEPLPLRPSETARRFRFADGAPGEIGIIAPVTSPFCNQCSRIRLTADGKLRTCLFSLREWDLRPALAAGESDDQLAARIRHAVWLKEERHHIGEPNFQKPARSMVHIGG